MKRLHLIHLLSSLVIFSCTSRSGEKKKSSFDVIEKNIPNTKTYDPSENISISLNENKNQTNDSILLYTGKISHLELPKPFRDHQIVKHFAYTLSYNEQHEQADWVAYELTSEEKIKRFNRTNKFLPDPLVITNSSNNSDYGKSGYDRGHLAPASDMEWSMTAVAESFYYSNMSPQVPGFNRGVWKRMEGLVRAWAVVNNSIYIVTGPVLTNGLATIGPDKVSVPKYFYKVILDYSEPSIKGIGFIIANASSQEPLQNFAVTIDSVEKFSGIDFYTQLPDLQENLIEKTLCLSCWTWGETKSRRAGGDNKTSISVQCTGITKAGNRCKHMTYSPNGRCFQHGGN